MGKYMKQLFEQPLLNNRVIVISETHDDKISMAQKIKVEENNKQVEFFLKNSFLFDKAGFKAFVRELQKLDLDES